jgi:hypothetical protein
MCIACKKDPNRGDEPLCSARSENNTNALRLGGFYYYQSSLNPERVSIYILNSNGTLGDTGIELPLTNAQSKFNSASFLSYISDNKSYWGVYHIEGANIKIDTWHADSNGKDYGYRRKGEILSDTSFVITSSELCNGSEFRNRYEVYYFYPLNNKPDSVTSLIP